MASNYISCGVSQEPENINIVVVSKTEKKKKILFKLISAYIDWQIKHQCQISTSDNFLILTEPGEAQSKFSKAYDLVNAEKMCIIYFIQINPMMHVSSIHID